VRLRTTACVFREDTDHGGGRKGMPSLRGHMRLSINSRTFLGLFMRFASFIVVSGQSAGRGLSAFLEHLLVLAVMRAVVIAPFRACQPDPLPHLQPPPHWDAGVLERDRDRNDAVCAVLRVCLKFVAWARCQMIRSIGIMRSLARAIKAAHPQIKDIKDLNS